jgi:pyridoxal phosphate enzyme (YggS family)
MSQAWQDRIRPQLEEVQQRIEHAAQRAGRSAESVRIVAISKGQPAEAIEAASLLGLVHIGENRVEEALRKQAQLTHIDLTWHMVGHIQSRKAGDIPGHFTWVHSIDRLKIADRINRYAQDQGLRLPILLECNVSGEDSKYGWNLSDRSTWPGLLRAFGEIIKFSNLDLCGLMTMAPWVEDESILRTTFRTLRELRDYLVQSLDHPLPELSMGMTDDFEYAIEEGATILRLGRAIFGARQW